MSRSQREEIDRQIVLKENQYIIAGLDIDYAHKKVSFDPEREKDISSAGILFPVYRESGGYHFNSMFRRTKTTDYNESGNPVTRALRNSDGWSFKNPEEEIVDVLRQFIRFSGNIWSHYDTIITLPEIKSNYDPIVRQPNELVTQFLYGLTKIITSDYRIDGWLSPPTTDHVYEGMIDWIGLHRDFPGQYSVLKNEIHDYFNEMDEKNNGEFSFHYVRNKNLLKFYTQMSEFQDGFYDNECLDLARFINDRDVLILDRIISGGIPDNLYCKHILMTYLFKSATVITLFESADNE